MTLEELARGATGKAAELHAENAALKEENAALRANIAELGEEQAAIAHKQGVSVSFEGDCFDGGKCGTGGFCDKCPLLKD